MLPATFLLERMMMPHQTPPPTPVYEVADLFIDYLDALGIAYVFGVPGGAIEPLYNAMARAMRQGRGPKPVVARHENGAAFMADGYARETGKIGVCIATSGPGATNLITGVACAFDNSVPLLAITGQPSLPSFGKRALQESACTGINTVGMFRHCTRYNSLLSHRDQAEGKLVNALMRATQTRGPVHLSVPVDILRMPLKQTGPSYDLSTLLYRPSLVDEAAVRELAELLRSTKRLAIVVGGGCGEAIDSILELAELFGARFVTTPDGKGFINPAHRLYYGVFGFAGHYTANAVLLDEPELVLAIGTSLGEWVSAAWCETVLNDKLIHIDESEEHLMRSPMAKLHVRGRISTVFQRLLELLKAGHLPPPPPVAPEVRPIEMLREPDKYRCNATPLKPQRLMYELTRYLPPSTRYVADAGNSTAWAIHYLQHHDRRREHHDLPPLEERRHFNGGWLRVIMDFAPMGWAIGAAIGIARGNRDCPVVCLTGDGSYLMNGQEITVAAEEQLNLIFVILNDGALGMVKHGQRLAGAEQICWQLPRVDFQLQAESLGIPGHILRSPHDFELLDWQAILRRDGPTLLDVRIDGEEVPPMNLRMKTLGTGK
ncbi:thiamine pyrophosphate-binding protein [Chitinimonas lacunae]|uniref:Thiamine pyrophosphate-binding protein n=1 Tax=Chitinimonas lacunae TaxID=1963018 RepID=A0ABV8MQA7_9NEIS